MICEIIILINVLMTYMFNNLYSYQLNQFFDDLCSCYLNQYFNNLYGL